MKEKDYILVSNLIRIESAVELICLVIPDKIVNINEQDIMKEKLWQWQDAIQEKIGQDLEDKE